MSSSMVFRLSFFRSTLIRAVAVMKLFLEDFSEEELTRYTQAGYSGEKCDDSRPQHHILRHAGSGYQTAFEPFVFTFMIHKKTATHTPFIKSICAAVLSYT